MVEVVLGELGLGDFRAGAVEGRAVAVGVEEVDHAGHQVRLPGQAARVAGERHGPGGGAVIGAVAGQDLVPAGVGAGQFDGVLVGIGAAQGEQELCSSRRG